MTLRNQLRRISERFFEIPLARALNALRITPNTVTFLGLAITASAAHLVSRGYFLYGGLVLIFASAMDMLDGSLARLTGKESDFGAALDSIVDRLAEALVLAALLVFYVWNDNNAGAFLAVATIVISFMVSYIRARGEGLGIPMKESGMVTRSERAIIMIIGLLSGELFSNGPIIALGVILGFSVISALQRVWHIWKTTR